MKVRFSTIRVFLSNKITLQIIVSLFLLVLCVYFIKNEHLEIQKIKGTISGANPWYICLGILITILYILLQSEMYIKSFKAIHSEISFSIAIRLFLKRNLISVFLPAGAFSSLAFFNKELRKHKITNTQIYFASYLYGLCGLLTVVVVAVPVMIYMLFKSSLSVAELLAFIFLLLLVVGMIVGVYSLIKKGWVYRVIKRYMPDVTILLDDVESTPFHRKQFLNTLLLSLCIEFVGIAHIYVAMLALGLIPSLEIACVGYVVMVILLIASPFLRGLGAIEVSMAFVFMQYGFSTLEAAATTLVFRFFEFWLPLIAGVLSFITRKDNILYRILPAIFIFILGIVNIISSVTPSLPLREKILQDMFSQGIIETSNQLVLLSGLILCMVSYYLFLGSRNAWKLALFLSGFSAVGHILKGVDYEEAMIASFSFLSLLVTHESYILKPNPSFQRRNILSILIVFAASFIYAIVGFYFLEKRHLGINFNFLDSLKIVSHIYFLFDKPELIPATHFGNLFLNSVYVSFAAVVLYAIYILMHPFTAQSESKQEEVIIKAGELVKRHGCSVMDYFKVYKDKHYYFSKDEESFISFKISGNYAVVLENPICADIVAMQNIIREFDQYCRRSGLISLYYRIPESSREVYHQLKKRTLIIGQEAIVDLEAFTLSGKNMKSVRNALNKIETSGYSLKIYEPPLKQGFIQKLHQVSDTWLRNNALEEIGFSQGVFDSKEIKQQTVLTIENSEEQVMAFLNIIPDYASNEGTYDLIRMSDESPNGSIDFLLVNLFQYFKDKQIRYVNIGLAPMAGIDKAENITERVIKFAYEKIRNFDHYRGLREYKEKFNPMWENKYIAYSNDFELIMLPNILKDVGRV